VLTPAHTVHMVARSEQKMMTTRRPKATDAGMSTYPLSPTSNIGIDVRRLTLLSGSAPGILLRASRGLLDVLGCGISVSGPVPFESGGGIDPVAEPKPPA